MSNSKISMFGVSASGKTCLLYAMSQVVGRGIRQNDNLVQIISNRASQQMKLNDGFMQLAQHRWPQTSDRTESYDFRVGIQYNGHYSDVIESLEIQDYRGGLLQTTSHLDQEEFDDLMHSFRGSSAIIFIVDGQTIIDALDDSDKHVSHRGNTDILRQFQAQSQIRFVENIFLEYKRVSHDVPPIMIAISKGDIFASEEEKLNAKRFVKQALPSIFAMGSGLTTAITVLSLGEKLGTDADGNLTGRLSLDTDFNIHVPLLFGIYSDLCYQYEETADEAERRGISAVLNFLRSLFADRVDLYINGRPAHAV